MLLRLALLCERAPSCWLGACAQNVADNARCKFGAGMRGVKDDGESI